MEVTPRDLLRRKITEKLEAFRESEEQSSALADLFHLFLDLDEESQKPPPFTINPLPQKNPNPFWPVFSDVTTTPIPWLSPPNPYTITMTTDASTTTIPQTTYSMRMSTGPWEDEDEGEEGEAGEPVPA